MTRLTTISAMLCALALGGCAAMQTPSGTISREQAMQAGDWRDVATNADRVRLRDWWGAWTEALASARSGGYAADVAAQGELLNPQAALPGVNLPAGTYHCRMTKLGARGSGGLAYVAYPRFSCRVEAAGTALAFVKLTGSQRQSGLIFPDADARRMVFLGTLALGDELRAPDYGADAARNQAAWVERIGPAQWRMVFPRPAFESIVDVLELVPAD